VIGLGGEVVEFLEERMFQAREMHSLDCSGGFLSLRFVKTHKSVNFVVCKMRNIPREGESDLL
jgi:hypothetical protein